MFRRIGSVLAVLTFLITSCRSPQSPQARLQSLEFLIDWQAEPTYLGIYYAKEMGEFEKLGLDVSIIQSWGANQAVTAVASGRYKIATASGGATVVGNNNNEQIVSLAVLYPQISTVVFGLASSNIASPKDLEGKRVGIYPASITRNEFDAFIKETRLDREKIQILSLTGADIPLLLAHRVDAVLHYGEMSPVQVDVDPSVPSPVPGKPKLFELWLANYGVKGYGLNIVTSRSSYARDGARLQAVADAAVRGYQAGCRNKEDAIRTFLKLFPQKSPDYVRMSWDRVCTAINDNFGLQSVAGWQQTIDTYQSLGLLKRHIEAKEILP